MPFPASSGLQLFLERLLSRSVLSDDERAAILGLPSHAVLAPRNTDFVCLGETVDHSCLVADGLVGSFGGSSSGRRQITSFFLSGDMVDLPSVVAPKSCFALQALTPTTILRIRHTDLREVAAAFPSVAEAFWRDCVIDAAIFAEWVVNVGSRDSRTRMAHCLCELGLRMERAKLGTRTHFPFQMTQSHLGEALGLTPVHVNRTLKALKDQGVLSIDKAAIVVHDWSALVEIGEFEASYLGLDMEPMRLGCFKGASVAP